MRILAIPEPASSAHPGGGINFHGPSAPQYLHQIPEPKATFKGR
jgi:hypothetical protein